MIMMQKQLFVPLMVCAFMARVLPLRNLMDVLVIAMTAHVSAVEVKVCCTTSIYIYTYNDSNN
jgi:hypothetical protein